MGLLGKAIKKGSTGILFGKKSKKSKVGQLKGGKGGMAILANAGTGKFHASKKAPVKKAAASASTLASGRISAARSQATDKRNTRAAAIRKDNLASRVSAARTGKRVAAARAKSTRVSAAKKAVRKAAPAKRSVSSVRRRKK